MALLGDEGVQQGVERGASVTYRQSSTKEANRKVIGLVRETGEINARRSDSCSTSTPPRPPAFSLTWSIAAS